MRSSLAVIRVKTAFGHTALTLLSTVISHWIVRAWIHRLAIQFSDRVGTRIAYLFSLLAILLVASVVLALLNQMFTRRVLRQEILTGHTSPTRSSVNAWATAKKPKSCTIHYGNVRRWRSMKPPGEWRYLVECIYKHFRVVFCCKCALSMNSREVSPLVEPEE